MKNTMKVENVLNCSFNNWFSQFQRVTMKSIILPLSIEFVDYLLADGVFLPKCEEHKFPLNEDDSDTEGWSDSDEDEEDKAPHFPEFDAKVKSAIQALGGNVFPKLNWSCPKDANWIALNKSLCCSCVTDIYLLLKSSDFISHDLTQPFKYCLDLPRAKEKFEETPLKFYLILRKWIEIDPSTEYRCFVKNNNLIAISQRDYTNFYDHITYQKDDIIEDISTFFEVHIKDNFPDENYVFDVYRNRKVSFTLQSY
ncbi:translation initiation factor eIF2 assembly protein-like [Centruroides vittatus]|uniref:translation initiation factor eIF2 assembly protein-like n=1 Tax=Centruroides vittatus TaxID=120091 RepID=UPI00350F7CFB